MKPITKSEATAVARLAKSAAHLPGTEDLRIHDACDDSGLVFPMHIACDPETMRSVEKIATAIQMHATRSPAKRGRPPAPPDARKNARVELRVHPGTKTAWQAKADSAGLSLAAWVEAALNAAK